MTDIAASIADLYIAFVGEIRAYIYRRTSCPELAADICHEVFARMLETQRAGVEIRNARAYAFRVARNLIIDRYRERDRMQVLSLEDITARVGEAAEYGDYAGFAVEIAERLLADPRNLEADALAALEFAEWTATVGHSMTPEQATVIQLRFLDGYEFTEVAAAVGKSEGAVKALQHRGLENLRQQGRAHVEA